MSNRKLNPWTLRSVRETFSKGDLFALAIRIVNGNQMVRQAISLVLDEGHLTQAQLKELGDYVAYWIDLKEGNKAFIAKLRAEDYLDSV